jgi:hypothetical protein
MLPCTRPQSTEVHIGAGWPSHTAQVTGVACLGVPGIPQTTTVPSEHASAMSSSQPQRASKMPAV